MKPTTDTATKTKIPWSKPEHVPLNCWVRCNKSIEHFVLRITGCSVSTCGGGIAFFELAEHYQYSTDRINWKPCVIETTATLNDYKTGEIIRPATDTEIEASRAARESGVIEVEIDGKRISCFVEE